MFESTMQNDRLDAMKYASSLLVSLVVHVALVSVLILVPLVFCNVLHPDEIVAFIMASPALPERPAPPAPPRAAVAAERLKGPEVICSDCAPIKIPNKIPDFEPPVETEAVPLTALAGPIIGLQPVYHGEKNGLDDYFNNIKAVKPPEPKHMPPKEPVPVISSLQESKLILRVNPEYPKIAAVTHTTGIVMLEAVINEEGDVTKLNVISGHPLLIEAARAAVLKWKYSPTVLNGEAVPVRATVKITFMLR
jgi:protein TonB